MASITHLPASGAYWMQRVYREPIEADFQLWRGALRNIPLPARRTSSIRCLSLLARRAPPCPRIASVQTRRLSCEGEQVSIASECRLYVGWGAPSLYPSWRPQHMDAMPSDGIASREPVRGKGGNVRAMSHSHGGTDAVHRARRGSRGAPSCTHLKDLPERSKVPASAIVAATVIAAWE